MEKIGKRDFLFVALLAVFSYFLLAQQKAFSVAAYNQLAAAKLAGAIPSVDILLMPAVMGIIASVLVYILLRLKFSHLTSFVTALLMVTSTSFVQNFASGSFSQLSSAVLFGMFDLNFSISAAKMMGNVFLLPMAVFGAYFALSKKRNLVAAFALVSIALTFAYPSLAMPLLAASCAYGIEKYTGHAESKRDDVVAGLLFALFAILFLVKASGIQALVFGAFASVLVAVALYFIEARHKVGLAMLTMIVFFSFVWATASIFSVQKIDAETLDALQQLRGLGGTVAAASIYGDNLTSAADYVANKRPDNAAAIRFLFSNETARFNYLLLDTLILDDPRGYATAAGVALSPKFESFAFYSRQTANNTPYAVFVSKNNYMIIYMNEKGQLLSDKVVVSGTEEVSFYRLLQLNATEPLFTRYIYPRGDTGLNVMRLLFPEQLTPLNATQIWSSNSSRLRLYKMG